MRLTAQKRLAAQVMKCAPKRVRFDSEKLSEIKEAITKADVRGLVIDKFVTKIPVRGTSRSRIRKRAEQRRKRRQKGHGSRKGKPTSRLSKKERWVRTIRIQRRFLQDLRKSEHIDNKTYRLLYARSNGGFFRSKRHLKGYIEENKLLKK